MLNRDYTKGNLTVTVVGDGRRATAMFGSVRHFESGAMIGTSSDRAKWFLDCLRKGKVEKFHPNHHLADGSAFAPLWCGVADPEGDFRPFVGKRLKRLPNVWGGWVLSSDP